MGEPDLIDLVRDLREAVGLFSGAMPVTPQHAWEEALVEVERLRAVVNSGACWVCGERERLVALLRQVDAHPTNDLLERIDQGLVNYDHRTSANGRSTEP